MEKHRGPKFTVLTQEKKKKYPTLQTQEEICLQNIHQSGYCHMFCIRKESYTSPQHSFGFSFLFQTTAHFYETETALKLLPAFSSKVPRVYHLPNHK